MMNRMIKGVIGAAALGAMAFTASLAQADALDDIKAAGVIKVGVKADYKPYGYLDSCYIIRDIDNNAITHRQQQYR